VKLAFWAIEAAGLTEVIAWPSGAIVGLKDRATGIGLAHWHRFLPFSPVPLQSLPNLHGGTHGPHMLFQKLWFKSQHQRTHGQRTRADFRAIWRRWVRFFKSCIRPRRSGTRCVKKTRVAQGAPSALASFFQEAPTNPLARLRAIPTY